MTDYNMIIYSNKIIFHHTPMYVKVSELVLHIHCVSRRELYRAISNLRLSGKSVTPVNSMRQKTQYCTAGSF
jgi:hypothetical protein